MFSKWRWRNRKSKRHGERGRNQIDAAGLGRARSEERVSLYRVVAAGMGPRVFSIVRRRRFCAACDAGAFALRAPGRGRRHVRAGLRRGPDDAQLCATIRARLCVRPLEGNAAAGARDSRGPPQHSMAVEQRSGSFVRGVEFRGLRFQLPGAATLAQRISDVSVRSRIASRAPARRCVSVSIQRRI